ncbi:hypothetical protein ACUN24_13155 [Pedobacter sp. WC2501]|uniref:hypothetical protein n=1 Tax=Pedobacter sp. WC2501 TaxID=3461400 RepID=UPI0040466F3A
MANKNLDFLIRKNKGKFLQQKYETIFISAGLFMDKIEYIDLEKSDYLINRIRAIFPEVREETEILSDNITVLDSKLLTKAFSMVDSDYCYIYSDDVYYCGMYLISSKLAQECCLNVAKLGYSNTCFVLDKELKFAIRINFYDEDDNEYKNNFDIQLKEA